MRALAVRHLPSVVLFAGVVAAWQVAVYSLVNGTALNLLGWGTTITTAVAAIALVVTSRR